MMAGAGIARHRDLGVIDMRRIAPTVAAVLKVPFSVAVAPLPVYAAPPGEPARPVTR